MPTNIIDFRVRPNYKGNWDSFYNPDGSSILETTYKSYDLNYHGAVASGVMTDLIAELRENRIVKAVIPAREKDGINNAETAEFAAQDPELFLPFPSLPLYAPKKALEEIEEFAADGKAKGVAIEPVFGAKTPVDITDEKLAPVYRRLSELGLVVLLTYSAHGFLGTYSEMPAWLDRVAAEYPKLNIAAVHGGWPYTLQTISVAMNRPNVFLTPDIYATGNPGGDDFWAAARTVLQDKVLFSTSFPNVPVPDYIEYVRRQLGDNEKIQSKIFYGNAARILHI